MKTFSGLAEFETAVDAHLGHSDWHSVTQNQIDLFAEATGDRQWIHTDQIEAAAGPFGSTIAHGYLTLSLVSMLVREIYSVQGLRMGVNYGVNKVRFPAPVPVKSRIRAGAQLLQLDRHSSGAKAIIRVVIEIDGSDKPACVAEIISLLVP